MIVRVQEILESDSYDSKFGTMYGFKMRATDEGGNEVWLGCSSTKPDGFRPGQEFDFQPTGKIVGPYTMGKRAQQQGGFQNRPQNAPQRPQSAPNPQQAPKAVPTMSQALSVLKECVEAVKTFGGSDAHATTLFLARLRGDIRKDPSPQELEAAAAAEAAKAQAAKEAAERAAAEAARQAALAAMPPAETLPEGDIPF
jgi:hypothetical protein